MTVAAPAAAGELLGPALAPMHRYAELLVDVGVPRGLIGPHEADRLWDRHLLNSAAVAPLLPRTGTMVDLGSGAGLPGVVLALLVPTLRVVLVDATRRRTDFLREVVEELALGEQVTVVWGRAEDLPPMAADVVVARAVAPLATLAAWSMPHLRAGGALLAIKGATAAEELRREAVGLRRHHVASHELLTLPAVGVSEPVHVIRLVRAERPVSRPRAARSAAGRAGAARRTTR